MAEQFTMQVSDRSLRRVQISMAAVQAADQTAQAALQALQNMVGQARKGLDDALGAICDANDQTLPADYTLTVNQAAGSITISTDVQPAGVTMLPPLEGQTNGQANGQGLLSAVPADVQREP
jgi:hypothetical protein